MIKDKFIKPLLFATEKVVEQYFLEEEKQPEKGGSSIEGNQEKIKCSQGGMTKTTEDTLSSTSSNELS